MKRKSVKYISSNGLSLVFTDKKPLYVEKIDATSLGGKFSTSVFARQNGQITDLQALSSRTIVCDFAYFEPNIKPETLQEIVNLFNPSEKGILTIHTEIKDYEIECYPSSVPMIKSEDGVYRFSVDFICDKPMFRTAQPIKQKLKVGVDNYINCKSVIDTPVRLIVEDCSKGCMIRLIKHGNSYEIRLLECNGSVTVDTENFTATDSTGADISNKISITSDIEDFKLSHGRNNIRINKAASLIWYELTLGVI